MLRRNFLLGIGSALLGGSPPPAVAGQPPALPVVGYIDTGPRNAISEGLLEQFRRGLGEEGRIEGQNIRISFAWADLSPDRLLDQLADLVHERIDVLSTASGSALAIAARSITAKIPIVCLLADEPIWRTLASSENGAVSNLTGVTVDATQLVAKRLDLLRAIVPAITLTGFLVNSRAPFAKPQIVAAEAAARVRGVRLVVLDARAPFEIERAFGTIDRQKIGALIVADDPLFLAEGTRLAAFAARQVVPAIYPYRQIVEAGGLMSYGADTAAVWRLGGVYAGRVLGGESPADLPVQAGKPQTAVNLATAKGLGLAVPSATMASADVVIR